MLYCVVLFCIVYVVVAPQDVSLMYLEKRILSQLDSLSPNEGQPVLFGGAKGPNFFLSNFYPSEMDIDGTKYNCVEQYYNATRARLAGREDLRERIMDLSPSLTDNCAQMDMLKLGRQGLDGNTNLQKEWDTKCLRIMITGLTAKFSQNDYLREELIKTGNRLLAEATCNRRWGTGVSWRHQHAGNSNRWPGNNILGKLLMYIRELL